MSLDLRLSDYSSAKNHVIYLVVRFPGSFMEPDGHDTEDVAVRHDRDDEEVEPATSTTSNEVAIRSNPRIVMRGTVTIPVTR